MRRLPALVLLLGILLSAAVPCPGLDLCWGGEGHFAAARAPAAESDGASHGHCPCSGESTEGPEDHDSHGPCRDLELEGLLDGREIVRESGEVLPLALGPIALFPAHVVILPEPPLLERWSTVETPPALPPSLSVLRGVVLRR